MAAAGRDISGTARKGLSFNILLVRVLVLDYVAGLEVWLVHDSTITKMFKLSAGLVRFTDAFRLSMGGGTLVKLCMLVLPLISSPFPPPPFPFLPPYHPLPPLPCSFSLLLPYPFIAIPISFPSFLSFPLLRLGSQRLSSPAGPDRAWPQNAF